MARNWLESRNGTLVQWKSKHVWALCKNFFEGLSTGFNFKISKVSCASCSLLFSYCTNCPGMPWPWPQFHRSTRRTVYRLPYHDHHRYASSTHIWLVFHKHLEVSSEMSPRSFTVGLDHDTCGRVGMCENQTGTTERNKLIYEGNRLGWTNRDCKSRSFFGRFSRVFIHAHTISPAQTISQANKAPCATAKRVETWPAWVSGPVVDGCWWYFKHFN